MSNERQKVCVIIPAYNAAEVIGRCLQSLQMQTFQCWTAIVVDDGSTDGTSREIARIAREDVRIRALQGRHAGASAARNQAMEEAERLHPAYITFLDADDYLERDALEVFYQTAVRTGVDVVHCKYFNEYVNGSRSDLGNLFPPDSIYHRDQFPKTVYWKMITGIQMNHACTKFYRAELLQGMRFDTSMRTGEDLLMNIEVFSRAESYAYIARPLYHYIRDMAHGLTNSGLPGRVKLECNWRISKRMLQCLPAWGMDTLRVRLCVVCRPVVLLCSKIYRRILAKWVQGKKCAATKDCGGIK